MTTQSQHGFTLVELMVVVVILAIFATMMTFSVGSSDVRKNRAFYEHLQDSLEYVRLVSAENMQPMGLVLASDLQGKMQPVVMKLQNPYAHLDSGSANTSNRSKNNMELSAMSVNSEQSQPSWVVVEDLTLPEIPANVTVDVISLDASTYSANSFATDKQLQPWFVGQQVPQVLWYGTGEANPVRIEVRYNKRLVGDALILTPDGRIEPDNKVVN